MSCFQYAGAEELNYLLGELSSDSDSDSDSDDSLFEETPGKIARMMDGEEVVTRRRALEDYIPDYNEDVYSDDENSADIVDIMRPLNEENNGVNAEQNETQSEQNHTNIEDIGEDPHDANYYNRFTCPELKAKCKERDLTGYSKLRKSALIDLLLKDDKEVFSEDELAQEWRVTSALKRAFSSVFLPKPGPTAAIKHLTRPKEFFLFFISMATLGLIATETNRYAVEKQDKRYNKRRQNAILRGLEEPVRPRNRFVTTAGEIMAFFGILIRMGLIPLRCAADYFDDNETYEIPSISRYISRRQFKQLMSYIHLPPCNEIPVLRKVGWLVNIVNQQFRAAWFPAQNVSIDEGMIPTKCFFSGLRVYMPDKPDKWGIKVWMAVDSLGFLYAFDIYTGKKGNNGNRTSNLGPTVVLHLVALFPDSIPWIITADNFFSSVELVRKLTSKKIFYNGTIRANRVVVNKLPYKSLKSGEFESFVQQPDCSIAITQWMDSKVVRFISNYCSTVYEGYQYVRRGSNTPTKMATCAREYRRNMGNVDSFDRNKKLYTVRRTVRRWWLSILLFVLDIVVVNSWKIYIHNNPDLPPRERTQKHFRRILAAELIGDGIRKRSKKKNLPTHSTIPPRATILKQKNEKRLRCQCRTECAQRTNKQCRYCDNHVSSGCEMYHYLTQHKGSKVFGPDSAS